MRQDTDKIKVELETGQTIEVVVTSISAAAIWILIGEGPHSSKCKLEPTRNSLAYAGSVIGREVIYQRSVQDVQEELTKKAQQDTSFRRR